MRRTSAAMVVLILALGACSEAGPSVQGTLATSDVALGKTDVPDDLDLCDYSGSIPEYLANVYEIDRDNHDSISQTWTTLLDKGAVDGHMSVYSESTLVCGYWITGPPAGRDHDVMRLVSSLVVRFPDAAAAEAAFRQNLFAQDKLVGAAGFGVEQGDATDLGPNSIVAIEGTTDTGAAQAVWQAGPFNVFVATRHLTSAEVDAALRAVNDRALAAT